jgi:hypothetical protein
MAYKIILFGDRDGNGAIVQVSTLFSVTTWTANNDNKGFEKWVCRETGETKHKGVWCAIDFFYVAQYDTRMNQ